MSASKLGLSVPAPGNELDRLLREYEESQRQAAAPSQPAVSPLDDGDDGSIEAARQRLTDIRSLRESYDAAQAQRAAEHTERMRQLEADRQGRTDIERAAAALRNIDPSPPPAPELPSSAHVIHRMSAQEFADYKRKAFAAQEQARRER